METGQALAICAVNSLATSFSVFFDLPLNKRLSKEW